MKAFERMRLISRAGLPFYPPARPQMAHTLDTQS